MQVALPDWSFDAALFLCERRAGRFRNRFASAKLRGLHRDQPYFRFSEGIIGYLGDIGAAIALGLDPVEMLKDMIVATDGLAHRDQFDLYYRGWNIDAKVEDFRDYHQAVIAGGLGYKDPYGCRLINADQYNENKGFTDVYLFGCFDAPMGDDRLLHDIDRVLWLGWVEASFVEQCAEQPFSPAGPRLPSWARLVPHEDLRPMEELIGAPIGGRAKSRTDERLMDEATATKIEELCSELDEICGRR